MAAWGEEAEYDSDPEDTPLPSMRRREASDDEGGEVSDGGGKPAGKGPRAGIGSDGESDGQGGAQVYDDDDDYVAEEEVEMEYYDEEEEFGEVEGELEKEVVEVEGIHPGDVGKVGSPQEEVRQSLESEGQQDSGQRFGGDTTEHNDKNQVGEQEKKENEPYAVPTAGAFYMHDDRFQDNGRGRRR